jgi:ribosomal-protein-alanine N-acetyltransferase
MIARPMTHDDVDAVLALEQVSSEYPWHGREPFERILSSGPALVVVDGTSIVGYLVTKREDNGTLLLAKMAVHPDQRRKGYGTLLLDEIERIARRDPSVVRLALHVRESNTAAFKLYLMRGFKLVEEVAHYYQRTGVTASDRKALMMMRDLRD